MSAPQHRFLWKNKKKYPRIKTKYSFLILLSGPIQKGCNYFLVKVNCLRSVYLLSHVSDAFSISLGYFSRQQIYNIFPIFFEG